jgi:hypothetical protein
MILLALFHVLEQSGDVSFSAAAIAVTTALLGSVVAGLGIMFKAYQAAVADQIADLRARIVSLEKDLSYERSLREQTTTALETTVGAFRGREQSNQPERGSAHA